MLFFKQFFSINDRSLKHVFLLCSIANDPQALLMENVANLIDNILNHSHACPRFFLALSRFCS